MGDRQFENPQTANLCKLIADSIIIRQIIDLMDKQSKDKTASIEIPVSSVNCHTCIFLISR